MSFSSLNYMSDHSHFSEATIKLNIVFLLIVFIPSVSFSGILSGLSGDKLKVEIKKQLVSGHHSVGYNNAKNLMFKVLDKHEGKVCSVYSPSECVVIRNEIPSHKIMNCEHTWPKSMGATGNPAGSDLHHLYPATTETNSRRSNYPFCEVVKVMWSFDGSFEGYNELGQECFEPPQNHKGNVARALFYFSIRYNYPIDDVQEQVLRKWHEEDPVDKGDIERNRLIEKHQGNSNLFITQPELVNRIENF